MATTRCIFTGRLFGIYSEGGATFSRIYTHAGKRSCRHRPAGHLRPILFKNWRTSRPKTASDGWPGDSDGVSPGAICQRRIRNLNSDICINTYIHRTFFPRMHVCVLLHSFLSRTLSFSRYSFFCFLLFLFDLGVTVSREIGTSFWSTTRSARGTDVHTTTYTAVHAYMEVYICTEYSCRGTSYVSYPGPLVERQETPVALRRTPTVPPRGCIPLSNSFS